MQIYLTQNGQQVPVSEYVTTYFKDNILHVFYDGKDHKYPANVGDSFTVKRTDKGIVYVEKVAIPDTYAGKVGYCLSFAEDKICMSFDEFLIRADNVKQIYPSKKFVTKTDSRRYAFLVAKKKDRKVFTPLLLWVSDKITSEELEDMIHEFRKYRKIYHPAEFTNILMSSNK